MMKYFCQTFGELLSSNYKIRKQNSKIPANFKLSNKQVSLHRLVVCFEYFGNSICDGRSRFSIFVFIFWAFNLLCFLSWSPPYLGRLLICVICVTSPTGSHFVCHILCVTLGHITYITLCVSYCVCHILCITFCVSHYVYHIVCVTSCRSH